MAGLALVKVVLKKKKIKSIFVLHFLDFGAFLDTFIELGISNNFTMLLFHSLLCYEGK
jgi:hypothetical protein